MLNNEPDLFLQIDYLGNTGLHYACKRNQVEVAKVILLKFGYLELINFMKFTPLYYAT